MTTVDEGIKQTIDILSITTALGTIMGILPEIAAVFSIVWSLIRIYETATVQRIIAKWTQKGQ